MNIPILNVLSARSYLLGLFLICLLGCGGCRKTAGISEIESELAPVAAGLSFAQETDLKELGVQGWDSDAEFEINAPQAQEIWERIGKRLGKPAAPPEFSRYRIYLKRISDPIIVGARSRQGQSRPFTVTVYSPGLDGKLDRQKDPFFVD